ncbi:class II D-tagatose-bisphosphate aldolase non-catalytic subunit [Devosia submarina]|uniref:class II D-tagatose-bisphosphate aldolase non-catalytic subunit n=1 Tax=Devosia submarina TaxID=1173082 RepID=UPI000D375542|nr:class II D-tagatose-bisphosphate aldolase, non-catalytic subunit [Devosia submarina]
MKVIRDLIAQNRSGVPVGMPSFCTANEQVLEAVLQYGATSTAPILVEATCNQVNQEGGYTGLTPQRYMDWIRSLAADRGLPLSRLILGGDHLGPNPWRHLSAETAMVEARELVRQFAAAGYTKIHLDASMALGGEAHPSFETVAARAADLCEVAERHAPEPDALVYVVGTEVPIPGGETEELNTLDVTSVDRLQKTLSTHKEAFEQRGLSDAWDRVVSVVTQPGVDFGHTTLYPFDAQRVKPLKDAILHQEGLTFEAHSTDYQTSDALRQLVSNHFFFLKVGPELTFRFREAIMALAEVERRMGVASPSGVIEALQSSMNSYPQYWRDYYRTEGKELELLQLFSYSDRIRYYWNFAEVQSALGRLVSNIEGIKVPDGLLLQHFGAAEFGAMSRDPRALIEARIGLTVQRYMAACGLVETEH